MTPVVRVVLIDVDSPPRVAEIADDDGIWEHILGGELDCQPLDGRIDLWFVDGEARPRNRYVAEAQRVVRGPFLLSACDDDGDTVSMTAAEIAEWVTRAARWPFVSELGPREPRRLG